MPRPLGLYSATLRKAAPLLAATPTAPMSTEPAAVRLSGVRLERGGRAVLDAIDLDVPRGSVTAVLGPSGTGKSTLLAALTGELAPAAGTVEVFGQPVPQDRRALLAMRKGIGVLLQGNGLLTDLSVAENVALPLRTHTDLPDAVIARLVAMKLHAVGLRAAADLYPRELSGGMARRVALARALALDPPLMLYDEPLTGLDPIASGVVMALVRRLNQTLGLTSIIVTHHVHETLPVADRAVVIANGGIVFSGTPAELEASDDPLVRQFLRGEPDGPIAFDSGAAFDTAARPEAA
jgi:phospholipid/cholesterol/gamma-HCH transport system ATP-binding protein